MRALRCALAAALLGAVALPSDAGGDLIVETVDHYFAHAKSIAFARIDRLGVPELEATVLESVRGAPAGAHVRVLAGLAPGAVAGSEVLLACGSDDPGGSWGGCVGGLVAGDVVALLSGAMMAYRLSPGVVERASVRLLAAGRPAPDLCVEATVRFPDEPGATATIRGTFRASDGTGTAAGAPLGAAPVAGELFVGSGGTSDRERTFTHVEVHTAKGYATFVGGALAPARDGCHAFEAWPAWPLARTPRALARVLAGSDAPVVLARGTLVVDKVSHPVVVDASGGLRVRSKHLKDGTPWMYVTPEGIGFETGPRDTWLVFVPAGLAAARAAVPEEDTGLAWTRLVPPGARVAWPVRRRIGSKDGPVVGEVRLAHVPDP
jgi:hypothetical protein